MKPVKKPEFRALKKSVVSQLTPEEVLTVEPAVAAERVEQQQPPQEIDHTATEYPAYYSEAQSYPVLQSVNNTGWQVSDIWRDLRIDDFCN